MRTTTQQAPKLLREYPMYFTLGSAEELDGEVQLVRPSWECGWYWSFGLLQRWDAKKRDIEFSAHLDSELNDYPGHWFDAMKAMFGASLVITDDKVLWRFCEVVRTIYTLKETAEVLGRGGSHYAANPCEALIKNEDEVHRINYEVIPALIDEMYKCLGV